MDHRNYLKLFLNKITPDDYNKFDSLSLIRANHLMAISKDKAPQISFIEFFENYLIGEDASISERKQLAKEIINLIVITKKEFGNAPPSVADEEILKALDEMICNLVSTKRNVARSLEKSEYKEDKEEPNISTDDSMKNSLTDVIISEIDPAMMANAVADVQFNRRNNLLTLWYKCENYLEKLKKEKGIIAKYQLDKYITVNGENVQYGKNMETETFEDKTDKEQVKLVAEPIKCMVQNLNALGPIQVQITNAPYMRIFKQFHLEGNGNKTLLILADNEYNAGHNADIGHESDITALYYSSTIHLALSRLLFLYPMKHTTNILIPNVLMFFDSEKEYAKIDKNFIGSVLLYAPNFNPKSVEAFEAKFRKQIFNALCIAANFQYEYVIINDGSAYDNKLPAERAIEIIREVSEKEFRGRLRRVIITKGATRFA